MFDISLLGAVLAGVLSFFTPCVLPMVPFYLSYMGGLSVAELRADGGVALGARRRLVASSVLFALGVSTIFVLLGMGATALGQVFARYLDPLSWVAAGLLTLFGLHFLGLVKIPLLYREARLDDGGTPTNVWGAYLMGLAFGFGWTPCVGPALASILMIASGMGDIWKGGTLLAVYGAGMTAPFVLAAAFAGPFLNWAARHRALVGKVEKAMGAMLILFAVLIVTGGVKYIADAMIRWVPAFTTIG